MHGPSIIYPTLILSTTTRFWPPSSTSFTYSPPVPKTSLLRQLLHPDTTAECSLEICEEVEVRTGKRKRQTDPITVAKKKVKNRRCWKKCKHQGNEQVHQSQFHCQKSQKKTPSQLKEKPNSHSSPRRTDIKFLTLMGTS